MVFLLVTIEVLAATCTDEKKKHTCVNINVCFEAKQNNKTNEHERRNKSLLLMYVTFTSQTHSLRFR